MSELIPYILLWLFIGATTQVLVIAELFALVLRALRAAPTEGGTLGRLDPAMLPGLGDVLLNCLIWPLMLAGGYALSRRLRRMVETLELDAGGRQEDQV